MKRTLITGASRGLGKELAQIFALNNHDLILHSKEQAFSVQRYGIAVDAINGDLGKLHTGELWECLPIDSLVNKAKEKDIDILINNAGIYTNKPIEDMSANEYEEMINVNMIAPILLTRGIWPIFQKKKSGMIININSLAGKTASKNESAYAASKHGLKGFMDSIQFDATKHNIKILNVYLGAMNTDMAKHRDDREKLIDPAEAAGIIFDMTKEYKSARVTEIVINRNIY